MKVEVEEGRYTYALCSTSGVCVPGMLSGKDGSAAYESIRASAPAQDRKATGKLVLSVHWPSDAAPESLDSAAVIGLKPSDAAKPASVGASCWVPPEPASNAAEPSKAHPVPSTDAAEPSSVGAYCGVPPELSSDGGEPPQTAHQQSELSTDAETYLHSARLSRHRSVHSTAKHSTASYVPNMATDLRYGLRRGQASKLQSPTICNEPTICNSGLQVDTILGEIGR